MLQGDNTQDENQNGDPLQAKVDAYRESVSSTATDLTITRAGRRADPRSKKEKGNSVQKVVSELKKKKGHRR